ncbi:MAG: 2-amino-4-hydroxy-6-hydroxymethyldihydropteridine diphosphokinase [Betaproteobacteria bacterium]|nr:2-amino-4-hydroxy-6-hydroxymethyldihydropteridine diphosphokinase [Betaproteobacteria bacterium]
MTLAFVGLGANLGEPRAQVLAAFDALGSLPGTSVTARSSLYRSAPLDVGPQGDFVNAVARLDTSLAADALLAGLHAIEARHGRERPAVGAPRTLDLDLLLYGDEQITAPALAVPHPRMHLRRFVLEPLLEIDQEVRIPGRGPAREFLARCTEQHVERLA